MSRLLHAAARGARIQMMYQRGWIPAVAVRTDDMYKYRIHPADEHLQYGPISTALRKLAEDTTWHFCSNRVLAIAAANEYAVYYYGEPDFELFYLFLAEALADEGM